jgi:two-component system chemotaxis response regulator CheY
MPQRILLIEPDPDSRAELKRLIAGSNYQVVAELPDCEKAVEAYKKVKPDVVILPIVSPKVGGIPTISVIKKTDPEAKIVVTYDVSSMHQVMEAMQEGARGRVKKPFRDHRPLEKIVMATASILTEPHKGPVFEMGKHMMVHYKTGGFFSRKKVGLLETLGPTDLDLRAEQKIDLQQNIKVYLPLGENKETLELQGVVLAVKEIVPQQSYEMAVHLPNVDEEDRDKIEHFIVNAIGKKT